MDTVTSVVKLTQLASETCSAHFSQADWILTLQPAFIAVVLPTPPTYTEHLYLHDPSSVIASAR